MKSVGLTALLLGAVLLTAGCPRGVNRGGDESTMPVENVDGPKVAAAVGRALFKGFTGASAPNQPNQPPPNSRP